IEVLLLADSIDAFWTSMPLDIEGKPFKSLSKGEIDFGLIPLLEEKTGEEPTAEETGVEDTLAAVKTALGDRVSEVRASQRLANSPACLVAVGHGPDLQVERLLAQQMQGLRPKPILELNIQHALVKAIASAQKASCQTDVDDLSALLFEQAQILDGDLPEDPAAFAARLNRLVTRGLSTN
ncbi:MAG: molecular chaperone HtpG, partial [Alphaproteobacteria bacterium]